MSVSHVPWLVALSVVIAVQGSYVGLLLSAPLDQAAGVRRRVLLAASAISLAVGIWSMHFVGMMAARLPAHVDFLVLPTLVSFLVCVLCVGVGVFAAHAAGPAWLRIGGGGIAMGGGISAMHYIGMMAVHSGAGHHHDPRFVVLSVLLAISASAAAISFLDRRDMKIPIIVASMILGLAISGMHYTAMVGFRFHDAELAAVPAGPALSRAALAMLTTVVAFGVSGAFLLSLVPEGTPRLASATAPARSVIENSATGSGEVSSEPIPPASAGAPMGGLGQPPARRLEALPVRMDGRDGMISVARVRAIRANAHYTAVFDGEAEYFCALSISAVEARLDPARFLRVHRSHIVALDAIASLRRAGDQGVAELDARTPYAAPVARSRMGHVKARVLRDASKDAAE